MSKAKLKLIPPTAEEDAKINAGIAADPDTMEWGDKEFAAALAVKRGRGRPAGSVSSLTKKPVTLRIDPDLLDAMRATGGGWQTRANEVLRGEFLKAGKR